MILTCQTCAARLALDDAKAPAQPFSVRCAKCGGTIDVRPPAVAASSDHPATGDTGAGESLTSAAAPVAPDEMLRLLARVLRDAALADGGSVARSAHAGGGRWDARRALVCLPPATRATVAAIFEAKGYEVTPATDAVAGVKSLREERAEVVVFAPDFDPVEQGALLISRELSALRMAERRRIFVVQVSPAARTADAHAAFLASVNLVINAAELDRSGAAFDRAVRAHQELYRDFERATGAATR